MPIWKCYLRGFETVQPRLGLNQCAGTRTPPKPRLELLIEITHLVSGLNEAQFLDISSQKEFSERQR